MSKKRKEFSVLKWIIFPLNSVVLAGIIAWFNLSVFGYRDGLPYTAIVALIGLFSILINRYTESDNRNLAKGAFVFEVFLTAALIVNACYSVSVQRKMSVARMAETGQKETITEIGKLKGSRTQREALRHLELTTTAQSVFADVEDILFWIMACELALYGLSAFTLFAIAKLVDDDDDDAPKETRTVEEFPAELDASNRPRLPRARLEKPTTHVSSEMTTTQRTQKNDTDGLKILRETLKLIAFHHPGVHFKADVKDDCVWIRSMVSDHGVQRTESAVKARLQILSDAVSMKPDRFRFWLEDFLQESGFEI